MKKLLFTLLLLIMAWATASAYDFMVNGIAYNKNSDGKSVTVTYTTSSKPTSSSHSSYTGSVTIPATVTYSGTTYSVTEIGSSAFYGCSGLTSVTSLATRPPTIDADAFDNTTYNAATLYVPRMSVSNYRSATGWRNFSGIKADDETVNGLTYYKNVDGKSVTVTYSDENYDNNYKGLKTADIPMSVTIRGTNYTVTSIGESAFRDCSGLTSVTIPNSVTSIGKYAFQNCSGLTSVTIPNSVTSIGNGAFFNCTGLTSVTIGNSVTSIRGSAFSGCSGLTSVTIPESVTSIGSEAFMGCTGLALLTLKEGLKVIDSGAFADCTSLKTVTIPNTVTTLKGQGKLNGCFSGCTDLTSVTIPNSVTEIGEWAFYDCSGLTSVTIGNSVTSIGDWAFRGCPLSSVTSLAETPPAVAGIEAFDSDTYLNATLYVPGDAVSAYKAAYGWCQFQSMEPISSNDGDANGDGKVDVKDINIVINIILGMDSKDNYSGADVNGDNKVDIVDLNTTINVILGV